MHASTESVHTRECVAHSHADRHAVLQTHGNKKEDDQWVVPHNIYLAVYSPSSVNVLAFDPSHGADQARGYAAKYCSKPERYFFLEGEKNGVKAWSLFCAIRKQNMLSYLYQLNK